LSAIAAAGAAVSTQHYLLPKPIGESSHVLWMAVIMPKSQFTLRRRCFNLILPDAPHTAGKLAPMQRKAARKCGNRFCH
jgi:hypothetical protein